MCAGYKDRDQLNVHDVSARGMNGWTFGFPIEEERLKGKHLKAELVPNKEQNIGLKCSTRSNRMLPWLFLQDYMGYRGQRKENIYIDDKYRISTNLFISSQICIS